MTQGDTDGNVHISTTTPTPTNPAGHLPPEKPDVPEYKYYPTDTIAAVTIAVLAVVIILTLLLVIRALRKRRRARQGEQFGHIQTVTTGVMGTGNKVAFICAASWEDQQCAFRTGPTQTDLYKRRKQLEA